MKERVIFRLKRWWPPGVSREYQADLYEEIKAGRKTSEWRDATEYWSDRLFKTGKDGITRPKVKRAWFVVGFPKGNIPRLETDIKNVVVHKDEDDYASVFEIQIENVVEVLE